jgi:monoamine oxidase
VQPVLNAFAGSPKALESLSSHDAVVWRERMAAVRPELAPRFGRAVLTTWADDPWARCAYLAQGVGADASDADALARPVELLHFAGEHTAGEWSGLMEGALRSGRRVAREIIENM